MTQPLWPNLRIIPRELNQQDLEDTLDAAQFHTFNQDTYRRFYGESFQKSNESAEIKKLKARIAELEQMIVEMQDDC